MPKNKAIFLLNMQVLSRSEGRQGRRKQERLTGYHRFLQLSSIPGYQFIRKICRLNGLKNGLNRVGSQAWAR
jgi:hypothetical protein